MEEELNEHDLEERLYAMLHHVDQSQNNVNQSSNQIDTTDLFENGARSTIRRYWRTSAETNPHVKINTPNNPHVKINNNPHVKINNNPYVKINTPKPPAPVVNTSISKPDTNTEPKEEKRRSPSPPPDVIDLSMFQSPPHNVKAVIEILENDDNNKFVLESSDEDEVVEVALPPKPTITIESSDEDEISVMKPISASKTPTHPAATSNNDKAISTSPVPSVVSSVSDDFIRSDCIALNISSHQTNNPRFDFSLHGSELTIQDTPAKKKKKRKNKETATSTPIAADNSANQSEECFATPKSKAKNKKKPKSNTAIQKSIPAPDFYDTDSNQFIIDITKSKNAYVVTEKSLPSADVYESDSSQSEAQVRVKETNITPKNVNTPSSDSIDKDNATKTNETVNSQHNNTNYTVDLMGNDSFITIDNTDITESFIMANVTGFTESEDYGDENQFPCNANMKKKKRKNKETATSTPIAADNSANQSEECFATPKSKAKNKKKPKSNTAIQKSIPAPDFYDTDSNQFIIDITKSKNAYVVTEKSLPSADVYESDSSQSEAQVRVKETNITPKNVNTPSSDSIDKDNATKTNETVNSQHNNTNYTVDLMGNDSFITIDNTDITESFIMANVTGFTESEDYGDENQFPCNANILKYVSSKVPSILNADLDFDNLKGNERVCKKRRYSMTALRAEMEKFYNESWGGEDFNHREIQKNMSRDKNLWHIDPKDRMPSYGQKKVRCNYCNRHGHRDDMCMRKPAVCYMCGISGHNESRCPSKICVNCGSPNHMFTNICRNCSTWANVTCSECNQRGHPSSHCPDLWRRYHNTIDVNMPMEKCFQAKKQVHQYCSGCSRRGHLIHACRTTVPFASHPINTPYVCVYRPIHTWQENKRYGSVSECIQNNSPSRQIHNKSFSQDSTISSATVTPTHGDKNKRQSKSPSHENHMNKKRNLSAGDEVKTSFIKTPTTSISRHNTPLTEAEEVDKDTNKVSKTNPDTAKEVTSNAPDFIPIGSSNHDNSGHVIQDNEVSDTSEVITSARMYITESIYKKLQTKEHQDWLKDTALNLLVTVRCCGGAYPFLSVKGKVADQETFRRLLRERKWEHDLEDGLPKTDVSCQGTGEAKVLGNLPKNRHCLIRYLTKALDTLKQNFGNPKEIHKELTFLQNRHDKLIKQKVINPTVLKHSRTNINNMLKKLNTVLLGQAGLANGSDSVNQLYSYQEKLSTLRGNTISNALRNEIGEHFHTIFSPNARDDYSELLKMLEHSTSTPIVKVDKRKKKNESGVNNLGWRPQIKKTNSIPPQQENPENTSSGNQNQKTIQIRKLKFFHNRLRNTKPAGAVHKRAKAELERKLHSFIASLSQKEKLTSKVMKKVKKAQQEAQNFLSL